MSKTRDEKKNCKKNVQTTVYNDSIGQSLKKFKTIIIRVFFWFLLFRFTCVKFHNGQLADCCVPVGDMYDAMVVCG